VFKIPFLISNVSGRLIPQKSNEDDLLWDLVKAINIEVLRLAEAGVKYIQIDEPTFTRQVETAVRIGFRLKSAFCAQVFVQFCLHLFRCLQQCWTGVPKNVIKGIHVCCGYTDSLDQKDYLKAENHSYIRVEESRQLL